MSNVDNTLATINSDIQSFPNTATSLTMCSDFQTVSGDCLTKCFCHYITWISIFQFSYLQITLKSLPCAQAVCFVTEKSLLFFFFMSFRIDWLNPQILVPQGTNIYILLIYMSVTGQQLCSLCHLETKADRRANTLAVASDQTRMKDWALEGHIDNQIFCPKVTCCTYGHKSLPRSSHMAPSSNEVGNDFSFWGKKVGELKTFEEHH